jgi:hypothetical protein
MPTENKLIQSLPEVKRWQLKGFIPGVEGESEAVFRPVVVLASDFDAVKSELAVLREELEEMKELGALPAPGPYGIELPEQTWDSIRQHAFELGGTDGGDYALDDSDLNELISFTVELMRRQPEANEHDA